MRLRRRRKRKRKGDSFIQMNLSLFSFLSSVLGLKHDTPLLWFLGDDGVESPEQADGRVEDLVNVVPCLGAAFEKLSIELLRHHAGFRRGDLSYLLLVALVADQHVGHILALQMAGDELVDVGDRDEAGPVGDGVHQQEYVVVPDPVGDELRKVLLSCSVKNLQDHSSTINRNRFPITVSKEIKKKKRERITEK